VNAISSPRNPIASPRRPARPKAARSPIPATAGGRTSGNSTAVTKNARPRKLRVAIRYAVGVPKSKISAFAINVVFSVTSSASTAAGSVIPSTSRPSGIWRKIARIGRSRNERVTAVANASAAPNRLLTGARSLPA
jgi:hypothetical protein